MAGNEHNLLVLLLTTLYTPLFDFTGAAQLTQFALLRNSLDSRARPEKHYRVNR